MPISLAARQEVLAEDNPEHALRFHGRQPLDERDAGGAERRADDAAGSRQDGALGEDLAHQLPAAGAEREPRRQLAAARRPAGEQEVRDVGAHDQEHDGRRAEEDPQDGADRAYRPSPDVPDSDRTCYPSGSGLRIARR